MKVSNNITAGLLNAEQQLEGVIATFDPEHQPGCEGVPHAVHLKSAELCLLANSREIIDPPPIDVLMISCNIPDLAGQILIHLSRDFSAS